MILNIHFFLLYRHFTGNYRKSSVFELECNIGNISGTVFFFFLWGNNWQLNLFLNFMFLIKLSVRSLGEMCCPQAKCSFMTDLRHLECCEKRTLAKFRLNISVTNTEITCQQGRGMASPMCLLLHVGYQG